MEVRESPATEKGATPAPMTATEVKGRVLVVDDDEGFRLTVAEILRLEGHEVREAEGPEEALAQLADGEVNVLLVDVGLPLGLGLALLERIDDSPAVILMSGSDEARVDDPRVSVFLAKPIRPERLVNEVAELLRNQ